MVAVKPPSFVDLCFMIKFSFCLVITVTKIIICAAIFLYDLVFSAPQRDLPSLAFICPFFYLVSSLLSFIAHPFSFTSSHTVTLLAESVF